MLNFLGHTTHLAHSGDEGIEKAKIIKSDIILCDIGLPEMDGFQVAKILKQHKDLRSTYFIALSGYAQSYDIEKAHAAGFNEHLAKPPNIEMLKKLLEHREVVTN